MGQTMERTLTRRALLAAITALMPLFGAGRAARAMARRHGETDDPKTRNWAAWEDRMPTIGRMGPKLLVTGEVLTEGRPSLRPAAPQGINPKILLLKLTVEAEQDDKPQDGKTQANKTQANKIWQQVRYEQNVNPGQYTEASILGRTGMIADLKIDITH